MNTCQTSMKTSILMMYLGPHQGCQRNETPQVVHNRSKLREEVKRTNRPTKYVSNKTTETVIAFSWSEQPTNLSAFWNRTLSFTFAGNADNFQRYG